MAYLIKSHFAGSLIPQKVLKPCRLVSTSSAQKNSGTSPPPSWTMLYNSSPPKCLEGYMLFQSPWSDRIGSQSKYHHPTLASTYASWWQLKYLFFQPQPTLCFLMTAEAFTLPTTTNFIKALQHIETAVHDYNSARVGNRISGMK